MKLQLITPPPKKRLCPLCKGTLKVISHYPNIGLIYECQKCLATFKETK